MDFSEKDRKSFRELAKEPPNFWVVTLGYVIFYCAYLLAKNNLGWNWLADLGLDLPLFVLFVLISGRFQVTAAHREFLAKISELHPELDQVSNSAVEDNVA